MGFFDEFEDSSGLNFVKKGEKAVLIEEAVVFPLEKVVYQPTSKYGPRFLVTTTLDGETRTLSFGAEGVESRDRLLEAYIAFQESEDFEPAMVYLEQSGQSVLIRDAADKE